MKRILSSLLLFVSLSTMAQQVIDTHAHIISQSYLDCLAKHDALLDEDFPIPHWDINEHL